MKPREFRLLDDFARARFRQWLDAQPLPIQIEAGPLKVKRTLSQNDRLWALHRLAAEHVGCTAEDMHEDMLCRAFGYTETRMPSGDVKRKPLRRSSDLQKPEFRQFMDEVENFYASELGVWLEAMAA